MDGVSTQQPPDKLQALYNSLKQNETVKGLPSDYNTFKTAMSDPDKSQKFYQAISQNETIQGLPKDFNSFSTALGLKKKEHDFGMGYKPTQQDIQQKQGLQDLQNGLEKSPNGSNPSPNTKQDWNTIFDKKALPGLAQQQQDKIANAPTYIKNPVQNKTEKNSWSNLGDFSANTVVGGLLKDAGETLKFLNTKIAPYTVGSMLSKISGGQDKPSEAINNLAQHLEGAGNFAQKQAEQKSLPTGVVGDLAKGAIGFAPYLLELGLMPEFEVSKVGKLGQVLIKYGGKYAPKAVDMAIGKFPLLMGAKGEIEGGPQKAVQEYGKGLAFEVGAAGAGKLSKLGIDALDKAGWLSGNKIVNWAQRALLHSTAQGAAFSTVPLVTNAVQGKPTTLDEIRNNWVFGSLTGLAHVPGVEGKPTTADEATAEMHQRSPVIDLHNFVTSDMEGIKSAHDLQATPGDLTVQSAVHAQNAYEEGDPEKKQQEVVQSAFNAKLSSVKTVTDAILKNKQAVIDGVNELPLSDDVKKQVIDKINDVHKQLDPVEQRKTELADKIKELQDNPGKDIIEQKENKLKLNDLNTELDNIIKKQHEQTKTAKEVPDEAPKADAAAETPGTDNAPDETSENNKITTKNQEDEKGDEKSGSQENGEKSSNQESGGKRHEKNDAQKNDVSTSGEGVGTSPETTEKITKDDSDGNIEKSLDKLSSKEAKEQLNDLPAGKIAHLAKHLDIHTKGGKDATIDRIIFHKIGRKENFESVSSPEYTELLKEIDKKSKELKDKTEVTNKKLKEQKADILDQMQEAREALGGEVTNESLKRLREKGYKIDFMRGAGKEASPQMTIVFNVKDDGTFKVSPDWLLDDSAEKQIKKQFTTDIDKKEPNETNKDNKNQKPGRPGNASFGEYKRDLTAARDNVAEAERIGNKKMAAFWKGEVDRIEKLNLDYTGKEAPKPLEKLPVAEHVELNNLLKEDNIKINDLKDAHNTQRDNSGEQDTQAAADEKALQQPKNDSPGNDGKDRPGQTAKGGEGTKEKPGFKKPAEPAKVEPTASEKSKAIADKIRSLQIRKGQANESILGIPIALYNGALETAAAIVEGGGKLVDAIDAAVKHIKEKQKDADEIKIRAELEANLASIGLEDRFTEPELIEANKAYMDAKVEGKFGSDALDSIISKLQDTNLEHLVKQVKEKIKVNNDYLKSVRERLLKNNFGSEQDQAALLMDQYNLKSQEDAIIEKINVEKDKEEIKKLQAKLDDVQGEILDNALANAYIGRQASSIFRLRQVAVDKDANMQYMREKYMASKGIKKLTPEQEEEIKQAYQKIRESELEVQKLKEAEKKVREEKEKLEQENEALKQIINKAKEKYSKSTQSTTERLATIRKSVERSKAELGKIFSANAIFNPEVYKHLKNIAVGKAEEIYVKTKQAADLKAVVKSVLDEIKDIAPQITENDVRDAIAGRDSAKPKTKTELQKQLAELRTQADLSKRINDIQNGIETETRKRGESSPKVKELQKQLAELKKSQKISADYESMEKGDLDTSTKQRTPAEPDERQKNINRYKAVQRKIKEIEGRLNNKDYTTVAKEAKKFEKSKELQKAEHKLAVRKFQWEKARKIDLQKNQSPGRKIINNILQWQRFDVLTYPSTLAKLAIVALKGVAIKPFQLMAQEAVYRIFHGIGKITGREGASGAIYGKVRLAAVAKFYSEFVRNFSIQNIKDAFSGMDEADLMYGKSKYMEDYDLGSGFHNSFLEFPGRTHGYIKSFLKKPETAFAHEQLMQHYIEKTQDIQKQLNEGGLSADKKAKLEQQLNQYDPSKDEVLERINALAAEHGKWSIFMNRNHAVEGTRTFFNSMMSKPSIATNAFGFLGKSEFPILKIPVNYARRYFLYKYGLLKALVGTDYKLSGGKIKETEEGTPGLIGIALRGTDGLTDQKKELLSRALTYGSMGAASYVAGMFLHNQITKNKDGSIDAGDTHIPKLALDSPVDESFLSGVIFAQKNEQSDADMQEWAKNFIKSDIDVVKNMPFTSQLQYGFLANAIQALYQKNDESIDKKLRGALDKKITDMVDPGILKQIAKMQQDDEGVKTKPQGLLETFESGLPYMWENVENTESSEKYKSKMQKP